MFALCFGACDGGCGSDAKDKAESTSAAAQYTVRGIVRGVTRGEKGQAPTTALIKHEAIPEFLDRDGQKVGMKAMTMSFSFGKGVSAEDVSVGDKIRMSFEVRWQGDDPLRIVSLEKLPKSTSLKFGQ